MNRSPMGRPTRPMPKMSAKKLAALGGFASSTFDKPASQTPAGGGNGSTPARGLTRSPMKASRPKPAVPPARRKTLTDRSERLCEAWLAGCWGRATDPHHRITRKDGGRRGAAKERSDRMSGLLHLCRPCHRWIHEHPAAAESMGLLIKDSAIPAQVPVLYRGRRVYLADAGGVHEYEAHCA